MQALLAVLHRMFGHDGQEVDTVQTQTHDVERLVFPLRKAERDAHVRESYQPVRSTGRPSGVMLESPLVA